MFWMRKVGVFILALMIMSSSMVVKIDAATDEMTQNEKASILNELSILQGDTNGNYNLDGLLTRKEAAAFIVRLLGKETTVSNNSDQYAYTPFTDVSPDEWYAPYVGYCYVNGIINGYSDKTFKPNDNVSEKAFLKLLLASLEYAYNVDYSWDSVFYTAYTAGIVTDVSYKTKKDDNTEFTRGDVVNNIFETLKLINRKTNLRMIQTFVDSLLITRDKAVTYGLIEDDVETSIVSVTPTGDSVIEVVFNEPVKDITADEVSIYRTDENSAPVEISGIVTGSKENSFLIVLKDKQAVDADYICQIASVIDKYGNEQYNLQGDFIGYRPSEIKSDFFMISKIEPVSNNLINIYFTQPINDNIAIPEYYTIMQSDKVFMKGTSSNIQVSKLSDANNGVSLYLKNDKFTADETYEVVVSGEATSLYGVELKDGEGDSVKFKASSEENEPLALNKITALSTNTIELDFNKTVNSVIAMQVFSYYLYDDDEKPIQILKADVDDTTGESVVLTIGTNLIKNEKYHLMINNINDASRQFSITEKLYDFVASYSTSSTVSIAGVGGIDTTTICIYLNKPLDEESAKTVTNYQITNITDGDNMGQPTTIYYDRAVDPYTVKLFLSESKPMASKKKYTVKIGADLEDAYGNELGKATNYSFSVGTISNSETMISSATIIGKDTIKLNISQELALDIKNILNSNYSLTYYENDIAYKKVPIGVTYIDPKTIILKFDNINNTKTYTMSFNQLVNYGGIITNGSLAKYIITVDLGE